MEECGIETRSSYWLSGAVLPCTPGTPGMSITSPSANFSAAKSQNTLVSVSLTSCPAAITGATVLVTPTNGDSAFSLLDNGVSPDSAANDGVYSANWSPNHNGSVTLNVEASGFGSTITGSVSGSVIENYVYDDQISYSWTDATSGTRLSLSDDSSALISIGFDFVFYGSTYNTVRVSSNGYLTFGTYGTVYSNAAIPSSTVPNNLIAPFWDDLNPSVGGYVYYLLGGTSPNRQLTVEWLNIPHYLYSTGAISFEATLYEGSNKIIFQYKDVNFGNEYYNNGASATSGVEDSAGGAGVQYTYNQSNLSDGLAISFYTPASSSCPNCSGSEVTIENTTFASGTTCECVGTKSIMARTGVTIETGATVTFTAPVVNLQPGFHVESGAVFNVNQ
jgi:hypothetical protein